MARGPVVKFTRREAQSEIRRAAAASTTTVAIIAPVSVPAERTHASSSSSSSRTRLTRRTYTRSVVALTLVRSRLGVSAYNLVEFSASFYSSNFLSTSVFLSDDGIIIEIYENTRTRLVLPSVLRIEEKGKFRDRLLYNCRRNIIL